MLTPEDKHYLLGYSDEQLVDEAIQEDDGHAAAILQERQRQDKLCLKWRADVPVMEIRTRVRRRRKQLKRLQAHFSTGNKRKKGGG